ncbi:NAD-P-binding protein [Neolentinus lepideus HHB14362 ss-1]|uniref:NAD-P-binding protein n=1 Tax=Neolentinus lepideus HHB14362 ss-1 TaxID=1314782 RepID=A0A165PBE2_9AGAM|nr:NAD-P-binding protein [Neolentinus lepideus HHB14362 ss-1]
MPLQFKMETLCHKLPKYLDRQLQGAMGDATGIDDSGPVTIAVIGCGQRGQAYAAYALSNPSKCKIVAMAEPRPNTCALFAQMYSIDGTLVFRDWAGLHAASAETIKTIGHRLADAVVVAVQDNMHLQVVEAFAEQGYHILCEKPMATSLEDIMKMEAAVKRAGIIFGMGHVLRYSPYSKAITEIVRSGTLGELINAVHVEPIGYFHFAHSYVRGNWAQEEESSFSLMTKSCHDIDILCNWFSPATPIRTSSFGSLKHFRKDVKPSAAADAQRCLKCPCERTCPYSAKKIYLDPVTDGEKGWPASTIVDGIPDIENIHEALEKGPYGRCVYESANDVCDNQVVNIEFSNGSTASFTMVAFTSLICERQTRLHFTYGEIVGDMSTFTVTDFRAGTSTLHTPPLEGGGHGGGDLGLIKTFVKAVKAGKQDMVGTNIDEVVKSHLTVFAAESSRKEGRVVDCIEYEKDVRRKVGLTAGRSN